jgi:hypothetical protein
LYTDVPKQDVVLQNSGIVKLGCNIHDWMIAYIYVHESQFLKKVNSSPVIFDGVLAGTYEVRVWNPRFRNTKRILKKVLTVVDGKNNEVKFDLALQKTIRMPKKPTTTDQTGNSYNYSNDK